MPTEITDSLPVKEFPRLRIEAEIDDVPVAGTLMPDRLGSPQTSHLEGALGEAGLQVWYLMASKKVLKQIGKRIGDEVEVRLRVADQSAVVIPDALAGYLDAQPEVREAWGKLTPGKQRGLHTAFRRRKLSRPLSAG